MLQRCVETLNLSFKLTDLAIFVLNDLFSGAMRLLLDIE